MVDIHTTIVKNNKWSSWTKFIFIIFTALFIIWLINAASSIISRNSDEINFKLASETVKWIYTNISASNQSHFNLASTLNNIYSPITQTSVQKYSLRFSLEESRLQRLYDSLSGNKTIKKFLKYGRCRLFTPMDFSNCHATKCTVINDMKRWREADAIILSDNNVPDGKRPHGQLWFTLIHESPVHLPIARSLVNEVNFTISYRLDSTIYSPYGSYQPFVKHDGPETRYPLPSRNFAVGKSKKVAWFVSNCAPNSPRKQYVKELSRHISVDIYGYCGTIKCPKNVSTDTSSPGCLKIIRENYKFYLSFENSLCSEYITEKFYKNALNNDILPIVMGASIEEYKRVAPPHSFIHVDQFESPAKLAEYLKYLDNNDTAYNEYFAWHGHGILHELDSQPQCAMCLLAHLSESFGPYWVPNVAQWWNTGCNGRKLRWKP